MLLNVAHRSLECVELADNIMVEAINVTLPRQGRKPYLVEDSLFIKLQGSSQSIKEASEVIQDILGRHSCKGVLFAKNAKEADDMWQDRRGALLSILSFIEGSEACTTDVW